MKLFSLLFALLLVGCDTYSTIVCYPNSSDCVKMNVVFPSLEECVKAVEAARLIQPNVSRTCVKNSIFGDRSRY